MIYINNNIEQNSEYQALFLRNTQDNSSTLERLQLLLDRSRKSNNQKKYFKDDNNLEILRTDLSNNFQKVLDFLIQQGSKKRSFYFSQTKMAQIIGCDRVTVQRATSYFESKGLLIKYRKDTWSVCLFIMSNKIYQYARGFKYKFLSLANFLKGLWNNQKDKNVTPLRIRKDINNNSSLVHPNLFINCGKWSPTDDRQWSTGYQNYVFNLNGEFERSIPDDHQLQNFQKILDEVEMNAKPNQEQLFWDGLVKVLKLSDHGLLKLKVFPATVVNACYKKLQQQNKVHDKVKWLIRECDNQCKTDGRPVAWYKYYDNLRTLNIDQNSPLIQEQQIDFLDLSKPKVKEIEIYSTRDLTKYKKEINVETLEKGILFLGDAIPAEFLIEMQQLIENKKAA